MKSEAGPLKARHYFQISFRHNWGQNLSYYSLAESPVTSTEALKNVSCCSNIYFLVSATLLCPGTIEDSPVCSFILSTSRVLCQPEHQYFFLLTQYALIHIATPPPASFCLHSFWKLYSRNLVSHSILGLIKSVTQFISHFSLHTSFSVSNLFYSACYA